MILIRWMLPCIFRSHLFSAAAAKNRGQPCTDWLSECFQEDVACGKIFRAFTSNRPGSGHESGGCETVIIGHCEERNDKARNLWQKPVLSIEKP